MRLGMSVGVSLLCAGLASTHLAAAPVPPDKNKETQTKLVGRWELVERTDPPMWKGHSYFIEFDKDGGHVLSVMQDGKETKRLTGTYKVAGDVVRVRVKDGLEFGDSTQVNYGILTLDESTLKVVNNDPRFVCKFRKCVK